MYLATVFAGLAIVLVLLVYWLRRRKNISKPRICILVLGDIGRSPRMQYHALSCAKAGYHVDLVGFGGICLILAILSNPQGGREGEGVVIWVIIMTIIMSNTCNYCNECTFWVIRGRRADEKIRYNSLGIIVLL